jgi:hypothetical protein
VRNLAVRTAFDPQRKRAKGGCRMLHSEYLNNFTVHQKENEISRASSTWEMHAEFYLKT